MNFIQIAWLSINPKRVHNIVSCNTAKGGHPVICINFHPPLANLIFPFRSERDRDEKFNDIRKRQEE